MSAESGPAEFVELITKGAALPKGKCRSILCGTAGTINFTIAGVAKTNVPLQQGYNPIRVDSVEAGGTCSDIWALY
jgi:hypothetical protein